MSVLPARPRRKPEINIIPLVDVLVVLIFFFLVSMQFRNLTMLNLDLPEMETAGKAENLQSLEIGISDDGIFYLNGSEISQTGLYEEIQLAGEANPDLPVLILADENSYLRFVTEIMDRCRKAGLLKIRLKTD